MVFFPASEEPLPVGDAAWPFVMLANGMASYLVGSSNQVLNYTAGQKVELPLDPQHPLHAYVMTGPGGMEVTLTADLDRNVVEAAGADQAGNYRVRAGGSEGVDWGFSVNLAAEQTRLDRIDCSADGRAPCQSNHQAGLQILFENRSAGPAKIAQQAFGLWAVS